MQFPKRNIDRNQQQKQRQQYVPDYPDEDYEMLYTDPNGNQILSPMIESQEQITDQDPKPKSVFQTVRNDLRYNPDMQQLIADQPIPSLVVNIPSRADERSPKLINVADDFDYNIRTLNARRSPKNYNQYYNNSGDDLDNQIPYDDEQQYYNQESQQRSDPRSFMFSRSRSPQVSQIYRNRNLSPYGNRMGAGGIIPFNRMSPSRNYELNSSDEKIIPEQQQYNNFKNYLGNTRTYNRPERYVNPALNQTVKNTIPQKDDIANKYNNRTYNNMSYQDIKKMAKRFTKVYDPNKNNHGLLVEESQVTVPGAQDEIFNNRYRVLSKMNKLSNILLAKKKRSPKYEPSYEDRYTGRSFNKDNREYEREFRDNSYGPDNKNSFNKRNLTKPRDEFKRRAISRSPDHKFLYVSLAMLSSKGPSCEDRIILRRMRLEKGGVVDLAQEENKSNKFKIRKAEPKKGGSKGGFYASPKYREKAAKIIQSWWRDLKVLYKDRLNKIIKIQSVWRGKFVRKYMYDLFYLNFLYISFCKKIENVLANHVRPYVWDKLFQKPETEEENYENVPRDNRLDTLEHIIRKDPRNDLNTKLRPAFKKWYNIVKKLNNKDKKGRNLVQIRADKENKLGDLRIAFNKWVYIKKILDANEKLNRDLGDDDDLRKEQNLKKINGLFKILDGMDKVTKKQAVDNVSPKLLDYLNNQAKNNKLKNLVRNKPLYEKKLLRKYLYQWYANANKNNYEVPEEDPNKNKQLDEIRARIFKNIVENIKKKQEKNLLRKYFYKYLKKVILSKIKDEKDKYKEREKELKDKELQICREYEEKIISYEKENDEDDIKKKIQLALENKRKEKKEQEEELLIQIEKNRNNNDFIYYARGSEILQRAVWRITHQDPLHAMSFNINSVLLVEKLKLILKIKKNTNKKLLRAALYRWKHNTIKKVNIDLLTLLFTKLLDIECNNARKKILERRLNQWRRNAGKPRPYDSLEKAKNIYDAVDLLKHTLINNLGDDFLERLDRTRNPRIFRKPLTKIYNRLDKASKNKLRDAFNKWRRNVKDYLIKDLLTKIMLKNYQKNNEDIKKKILAKYFYRWRNKACDMNIKIIKNTLKLIEMKENETKNLFMKYMLNGLDKKTRDDILRKYFYKWKREVNIDKDYDILRNKRNYLLKNIFDKKEKDEYINLLQYFLRWRNKVAELKAKDAPIPFRKTVVSILLTKNDKEELQRCFTKWKYGGLKKLPIMPFIVARRILKKLLCRRPFNEFVQKMTERNPKVLKKKGSDLIRMLEDVLLRKPFNDLVNSLKLYNCINKLKNVQPKIHDVIKNYYLRKYLQRWIDNTLGVTERRREILISWLKKRMDKYKKEKEARMKYLLDIILYRSDRNTNLILSYALLKWSKNARRDYQIENAKIIQKFCRRILATAIKQKIECEKKLAKYIFGLRTKKFIDDLKNLCNETVDTYNDLEKEKKYRLDKLRNAINENEKLKNKDLLRKAFNTWRDNKAIYDKYSLVLQKNIRMLFAKNKLKNRKKLLKILEQIYKYRFDNEADLLNYGFHKWLLNKKKIECEENSKIIEDFCRKKLDKYLFNKFRDLLERLAKKKLLNTINNISKLNKLKNALKHRPNQDALDAIKRAALMDLIKQYLFNIVNNKDNKIRKLLLRKYLRKWLKKVNDFNDREKNAADMINRTTKGYLFRKWFNLDKKRLRYLKNLFDRVAKMNPQELLRCSLAKWRKNTQRLKCEDNAKIIQDFCRKVLDKINQNKLKKNKDNYLNLAKILDNIKVSPKEFFDRLKEIQKLSTLNDLCNHLADKRLKTLKDAFDKIKNSPKDKYLLRALKVPEDLKKRILRKYLIEWRNKAMRNKAIMIFLLSILRNFDDWKENILRYNLNRWLCHAHYLTQLKNAKIIQDFCRPIVSNINAMRNWHKLADKLRNKNHNDEIYDILKKLRIILGLKKLIKPVSLRAKKDGFDALNKKRMVKLFCKKIKIIIDRNENDNTQDLLKKYFNKWRDQVNKLADKENGAKDIMYILDLLRSRKATPNITNVSLLKKFLNDYPKIRAIGFLRKLRDYALEKAKNDALAKDLLSAKNDLSPQKRLNLIKKLYKIYAYKVLDKFFDLLLKNLQYTADDAKRDFFDELYAIQMRNNERSYNDQKEGSLVPKNKKTTFKLKKSNPLREQKNKKLAYISLIGPFVKYLDDKIQRTKKETFDKLKYGTNANKFCDLYKKWALKQELPPKKELVDKLRKDYRYAMTNGPLLEKLFRILRHYVIRRLLKDAPKIRKVNGMAYVTKLLIMNKNIATERFLRQLIRRWRYITFSKKLATNKMKTIYKNLHMTYLEMANCLFGDEGKEDPSVIKEFERFGTSVGMWENIKPKKEEKKYCKVVKTSYVFDDIGFEEFEKQNYPQYKYEEKEFTEEKEYKKYYQDEDQKEK